MSTKPMTIEARHALILDATDAVISRECQPWRFIPKSPKTEAAMADIRFVALSTATVRAYQRGASDAYDRAPERGVSDGSGLPCRHCLSEIAAGDEYLLIAHRPFSELQPYAETGPIFVHAKACEPHPSTSTIPELFLTRSQMLVRGYGADERIIYGTGVVVPSARIAETASAILDNPEVAFVDLRSASNNCYQCRVVRAAEERATE